MNRFSGASLRGGTPKTNMTMKKYITPNTETMVALQCFAICDPSAGGGQQEEPNPSGKPGGAPKRVF